MKLLFVVPDFHPNISGYAHACTAFVHAVSASGWCTSDVMTYVPLGAYREFECDGVRVHRLIRRALAGRTHVLVDDFRLWRRIRQLMVSTRYDFVVFETAEYPLAGYLAARALGDRVVVRVHGCAETEWLLWRNEHGYRIKRWPTRRFFETAHNIFATTAYYLEFVRKFFLDENALRAAGKCFQVIPNIVLPSTGRPGQEKVVPQALRALLDGEHVVFLTLGRLDHYGLLQKNFVRVLVALKRLALASYFDKLRLIVVGDGTARPVLERLATELGIEATIVFVPSLPPAAVEWLQVRCSGVILASVFEGQSMFALEALSRGAPLLCARTGGLADLVEEGVNGVLFDPYDVDDIARQIDVYVQELSCRRAELGARSISRYCELFAPERTVRRFREALETVAARRRAFEGGAAGVGREDAVGMGKRYAPAHRTDSH